MNAPAQLPAQKVNLGILMDPTGFEHVQRVATMMANSLLFPEHLRKGGQAQAIANAVLVIDMAARMNENPLAVAQNILIIGAIPGWRTTYMIARANQSGVFSDQIDWRVTGKGESLSVTAFATLSKSDQKATMTCDMAMAKAENWTKNSKYQSMPEVMLRYRSATMLIRMYAPEVMIGVPSAIELETGEFKDITPPPTVSEPEPAPEPEADTIEDAEEVSAEVADVEDEADSARQAAAEQIKDAIQQDLIEAPSVKAVREFYAAKIEEIKAAFPDTHKTIEEMLAEAEKAEAAT